MCFRSGKMLVIKSFDVVSSDASGKLIDKTATKTVGKTVNANTNNRTPTVAKGKGSDNTVARVPPALWLGERKGKAD